MFILNEIVTPNGLLHITREIQSHTFIASTNRNFMRGRIEILVLVLQLGEWVQNTNVQNTNVEYTNVQNTNQIKIPQTISK